MKAGEKIDLHRTDEEDESFYLGTVEVVKDTDIDVIQHTLNAAWSLFQHGPDEADFTSTDEYEAALDKFGAGQPDSDSEIITFLVRHYGHTFRRSEGSPYQFDFGRGAFV